MGCNAFAVTCYLLGIKYLRTDSILIISDCLGFNLIDILIPNTRDWSIEMAE